MAMVSPGVSRQVTVELESECSPNPTETSASLATYGRTPYTGTLVAGDYLVEALLARPASAETCGKAFTRMGWQDVIVDESPRKTASTIVRFVGKVPEDKRMALAETGAIKWTYVKKLVLDPYADLRDGDVLPFKLITGETSEARFLSRLGQRDIRGGALSRDVVENLLRNMSGSEKVPGFSVLKLASLRENMRLPGNPGAGQTLWLAILRWDGPKSVILLRDPLYFEDLVPIQSEVSAGITDG
jgi:hypothetical protein